MRKLTFLVIASIVFSVTTAYAQYTDVNDLNYPTGGYPLGALVQSGNLLYGMNSNGGANGEGCIFSININGTGYTDLFDFNGTNGASPYGSLVISGNQLFGMTSSGGATSEGNIFSIKTDGTNFKDLMDFNGTNGAFPDGSLAISGAVLYGMTEQGGSHHKGCIFSIDTNGSLYSDLLDFNTSNGANPTGSLIYSSGVLYGMSTYGGAHNQGCLFSINSNGSGYVDLLDFNNTNGANPEGGLLLSGNKLYGMASKGGAHNYGNIFSITTGGSGYTDMLDFNGTNGASPYGSLIISPNGLLYGMTEDGGANSYGCIFSVQTSGSGYSDLYDFNYTTGGNPQGSLVFSTGILYGMTTYGGANDNGVIFNYSSCTLGLTIGSVANILCYGNSGSATAAISGGVSPYTYNWTNGSTTAIATGLSAGSYTVTVMDFNSCTQTAAVTITQPASALSLSTAILAQVSCGGYNNGNIMANVSGGISPYTYLWSNGTSNVSISNPTRAILTAGSYTVTVTDNNGCASTSAITLTQPVPIRDSIVSLTNVGCNGGNGGNATIGVKGGKFPYTYSWAPNSNTTKFASSLSAGLYTVSVTDNMGCNNTLGVLITQPAVLHDSASSITYPACNGGKGSINIGVTGGNSPYTYIWSPGVSTTASATNLTARTYTITIRDKYNCPISPLYVTLTQPGAIRDTIVQATKVNVSCNGGNNGKATIGVSNGTPPYTYTWSNGQTNATVTGLSAGIYSVSVTDNNGCASTTTTVTITQPNGVRDSVSSQTNVRCIGGANGFAGIGVKNGVAPYTFLWSPTGKTTQSVTGLSAGIYTVTLTDNHGCANNIIITITQPNPLSAGITGTNITCNGNNNGKAIANISGGTAPYTYSWSNGNTTASETGLSSGTYSLTVHDNCSGSATASVTITQPSVLTGAAAQNPGGGCSGGNSGVATVTPGGGTPAYTYLWSDASSQTTAIATGLSAGNYTVTVTDANNCNASASVTITQASTLTASASINSNVTCNGGSNGSATANPSGGTSPYNYVWSDVNTQTNATANGLAAGSYTVTVTDANSCSATASVMISQPVALSTGANTIMNVGCNGGNTGSASASPSGGTMPYSYLWSDGNSQTSASASGLSAGTYTVSVTDNCSVTVTASVTITEPLALSAVANVNSNVSCHGGNNGSATGTPSGGTSPYNYAWSDANSQSTASAGGLVAGTYTVTVSDANNCTATASVTISEPVILSASASANNNVGCNGGNNGSATANANGGTPSYTYLWSDANSQTNAVANNLSAGTYTVIISDSCGGTATASVVITQPSDPLTTGASINSNVTCNGGSNGSATANPSGGTSPYNYVWSDVNTQTNATANGLAAGSYTVTVTDANSCSATASVMISQPVALSTGANTIMNVGCNGGNTGSASASPSGGTMPYSYLWSDGNSQTSASASGLSAGTYTVSVTDNCSVTVTASVTITEPLALSAVANVNSNVSCHGGNNGSATGTPSGGTSPYNYAWSDANSQSTASAGGLVAGTYTVTVSDANNCTATASVTISEPVILSASASANNNVGCNGGNNGSATANANGGTPSYTYLWSDANSQTNAIANNLSAGTYTVIISDSCGGTATASVVITQPSDPLTTGASINSNVTCNGGSNGSATANPSGGTSPYNYVWSDVNTQTNATANGLAAGSYTVTVTDANSCSATASVMISQPVALSTGANTIMNVGCNGGNTGSASASPSGGTMPYSYLWSDGNSQTSASASGLSAGTYTVSVTDNCSVTVTASVTITEPLALSAVANVNSNVSCHGGNNGSATGTPSGGTSPYNYAWSDANSQSTASAGGLVAGTYTVTVSDANNCSATASVTISEPVILNVTIPISANITCNGAKNGTATALAAGGNSPYTYSWSNGLTGTSAYASTSASASGMPGTYTYTVTIHDQCAATATATVVISNPAVVSATFTRTQASACGNVLGTAVANATGGTPPYVSYVWSTGQTTSAITGLGQATYTVVITDNNGCTGSPTVAITKAAPIAITFTSVTNVGCSGGNGGSVQSLPGGGTLPYTFSWSNGQTSQTANTLSAGTYTLTIYDSYNCSGSASVTITQPAAIRDSIAVVTYPACYGNKGSVTLGIKGGTAPYTYLWTNGNTTISSTGLVVGTYSVSIKDNHGCSTSLVFTITQPAAIRDSISSSSCSSNLVTATLGVKGGTNPYTYAWSPGGGTNATESGLSPGTYSITVTDAHGCSASTKPNLSCPPETPHEKDSNSGPVKCCEGLDNVNLYPNPSTGQLHIAGIKAGMIVEMYDYTGRKVGSFTASDITMQFNIADQPNGVYLIRVMSDDGNLISERKVVKTQ